MSTSSEKKPTKLSQEREATKEDEEDKTKPQIDDIVKFLKDNEHFATAYPDIGLVVGVRFHSIPHSRSVHVSFTNVLDLHSCDLPKLTMQKDVLECVNRDLRALFEDLELYDRLESRSIVTPLGRIEFDVLNSSSSPEKSSLIRETRKNYVVTSEMVDKESYTWFCEPKDVLNLQDFNLSRRSDEIAMAPKVRRTIESEKWELLENGMTKAWFSFLCLLLGVAGTSGVIYSLFVGGLGWILSGLIAIFAVTLGAWYGKTARQGLDSFKENMILEEEKFSQIGDLARTRSHFIEKAEAFKKIKSANFVTSILVSGVIEALESARIKRAAESSGIIIEKCAMNSSTKRELVPDEGLSLFLGLFEELEANLTDDEFDELAICYAGLSGDINDNERALVAYMVNLYTALSRAGLIDKSHLERIHDAINLLSTAEFFNEKIESEVPEDLPESPEDDESPESEKNDDSSESVGKYPHLFERLSSADISAIGNKNEDEDNREGDKLEVTGQEVVDATIKGSPLEGGASENHIDGKEVS